MPEDMSPMDKFGKFFVENFRDKSLRHLQFMVDGKWKAPELQSLQDKLSKLPAELRKTIWELAENMLTYAMHGLLFAFQEFHDCNSGIESWLTANRLLNYLTDFTVKYSEKTAGLSASASFQPRRKLNGLVGRRRRLRKFSNNRLTHGKNRSGP
jgi:hypothetical protein